MYLKIQSLYISQHLWSYPKAIHLSPMGVWITEKSSLWWEWGNWAIVYSTIFFSSECYWKRKQSCTSLWPQSLKFTQLYTADRNYTVNHGYLYVVSEMNMRIHSTAFLHMYVWSICSLCTLREARGHQPTALPLTTAQSLKTRSHTETRAKLTTREA